MTSQQIADDLADRIDAGEYAPHTKLPSTQELAELYSVSTGTIAHVQRLLRDRGLTYGVPGAGVFVEDRPDGDS